MNEPIAPVNKLARGWIWAVVLGSPFWFLVGVFVIWWWQR